MIDINIIFYNMYDMLQEFIPLLLAPDENWFPPVITVSGAKKRFQKHLNR